MKLWQKEGNTNTHVDQFTVGNDRELDLVLAPYDVLGSLAHAAMLQKIGLLSEGEAADISETLKKIYRQILDGGFSMNENVEDIHSQIEMMLTAQLGDTGKKIHAARSRNDQVLVDLKLFFRNQIQAIAERARNLFELLLQKSETHKKDLLPGYTHFQLAMPSSFGLWFGAYAESLADDMISLQAAWRVVNKNPLGSAAGFGSSFPVDRSYTTRLLGFDDLHYNVVYAQMTRGKTEKILAQAIANIAATLNKLSADVCLYMNQNFGFISFPDELTTGSSIMPHKKNPDVFELIRAHSNRLQSLPNEMNLLTTNLPSGYHRDMQLLKEILFPAIVKVNECLQMTGMMLSNIRVKKDILADPEYALLYTVEEMNKLVLSGMPMRDAYRKIADDVASGKFSAGANINHTHEGSIGNLQHDAIRKNMENIMEGFNFEKVEKAVSKLLGEELFPIGTGSEGNNS